MKRFLGVDLHKNRFTICAMNESGEYKLAVFSLEVNGLERFKETLTQEDEVAVESTGNAGYFAREIKGLVKEIRIINPIRVVFFIVSLILWLIHQFFLWLESLRTLSIISEKAKAACRPWYALLLIFIHELHDNLISFSTVIKFICVPEQARKS